MTKTAYITTPIYYATGTPHIGSAYTGIAADVYTRFKRLDGFDTKFLTGTDEHGLKVQRKAEELGKTPQQFVDEVSAEFKEMGEVINLSEHQFIRTTDETHKKTAKEMWKRLVDAGLIYKDKYSGWYCVSDEAYFNEDELVQGKNGEKLSPDSGHVVEWLEEESYFFKLSSFTDKLLKLYEEHPKLIQPDFRRNEIINFIKQGLHDFSISRATFNWGVPVPDDDKHVMYVWVDALTNYLSGIGWPNSEEMRYWPAIHLIGKEITRFHAIYWPAMLMGAGVELPKKVFAHGWWTVDGQKMSKSIGNVINPKDLMAEFGVDQVRYFLLREVPFGGDGDFSKNRLTQRINSELANDLGNLFQRVLSMVAKNCDGKIPPMGELSSEDKALLAIKPLVKAREHMDELNFTAVLDEIWLLIRSANKYMDRTKPWALRKENPAQMEHTLRVLMESFTHISLLIEPFMPKAAGIFQNLIGFNNKTFADLEGEGIKLITGVNLPKPTGVFMRINTEVAA